MNEDKFVVKTANMASWPSNEIELWRRIAVHSFEDPDHHLTFTARLARDHGWSLEYARRAVEEYRRFCFLAVTGGGQATPSEEVDEVWHQHLTFSRDYWEEWCGKVLRTSLHHQPTKGGSSEGERFAEQYADTLARYEERFGPPDPVFWPGTVERFRGGRFMVVDLDSTVTIPVPRAFGRALRRLGRFFGALAAGAAILVSKPAAAALGPLDWQGRDFLELYAILAVAALVLSIGYRFYLRQARFGATIGARRLDATELALLAAGRERAADVLALDLMRAGHLRVSGDKIEVLERSRSSGPSDADILRRHGTEFSRASVSRLLEPPIRARWERLAQDGLALSPGQVASIRSVTVGLFALVVAFGLAKLVFGLQRGKPVGFLVVALVITAVVGLIATTVGKLATGAGARVLADFKRSNERALRAPRAGEVVTAFAILGAAALVGTPLAAYANVIPKSDGGSGSGCGGGSGGGDGGGGCGGCGGGGGD